MPRPRLHTNPHGEYGRLLIVEEVQGTAYSRKILCKCSCGESVVVDLSKLISGNTKSCGCLKKETNKKIWGTHGKSGIKLHRVWNSMKQRCSNPKDAAHKNYGGRGIRICPEWLEFQTFYDWSIANGYSEGLTIDRINNDGNYEPSNCRWISRAEQSKNRRKYQVGPRSKTTGKFIQIEKGE